MWVFATEEGCGTKQDCFAALVAVHKERSNVVQVVELFPIEGREWLHGKCLSHLVEWVFVLDDFVAEAIVLAESVQRKLLLRYLAHETAHFSLHILHFSDDLLGLGSEQRSRACVPTHWSDHLLHLLELVALNLLPDSRHDCLCELEGKIVGRVKDLVSQPLLESVFAFFVVVCFLSELFHFRGRVLCKAS